MMGFPPQPQTTKNHKATPNKSQNQFTFLKPIKQISAQQAHWCKSLAMDEKHLRNSAFELFSNFAVNRFCNAKMRTKIKKAF